MEPVLVIVHLFLAIGLIALILIQHGKGADMGAAFGAGASSTVFGSRGAANFLSRTTAILAALFFLTSLALAYFAMTTSEPTTVMDGHAPAAVTAPATEQAAPAAKEDVPSVREDLPTVPDEKPAVPTNEALPVVPDDQPVAPAADTTAAPSASTDTAVPTPAPSTEEPATAPAEGQK